MLPLEGTAYKCNWHLTRNLKHKYTHQTSSRLLRGGRDLCGASLLCFWGVASLYTVVFPLLIDSIYLLPVSTTRWLAITFEIVDCLCLNMSRFRVKMVRYNPNWQIWFSLEAHCRYRSPLDQWNRTSLFSFAAPFWSEGAISKVVFSLDLHWKEGSLKSCPPLLCISSQYVARKMCLNFNCQQLKLACPRMKEAGGPQIAIHLNELLPFSPMSFFFLFFFAICEL